MVRNVHPLLQAHRAQEELDGQGDELDFDQARMYPCLRCGTGRKVLADPCATCLLRAKLEVTTNSMVRLQARNHELAQQVDSITGMKGCLEMCDEQDLLALKVLAYEYREDPTRTVISPNQEGRERGKLRVNGFRVQHRVPRERSATVRTVTMESMGGLAMAGEYFDACKMYKTKNASAMFLRAMGAHLEVNSS